MRRVVGRLVPCVHEESTSTVIKSSEKALPESYLVLQLQDMVSGPTYGKAHVVASND